MWPTVVLNVIFVTVLSLKYTFPESASIVISPAESKNILAVDDSIVVGAVELPRNNLLPVLIYAISLASPPVFSPCIFVLFAIVTAPSISTTSKLVVPSTSKSPLKSTLPDALKVLASISPLALILPEAVTLPNNMTGLGAFGLLICTPVKSPSSLIPMVVPESSSTSLLLI